ncbi:hypothetical protein BWI15_29475 [Kribbella sp. ALI-6-A]|nr:hypothetical protein BWI15_29475 [Kribbella sp. ALI-6-A]
MVAGEQQDWSEVAALSRSIEAELPQVAAKIAEHIRAEVPRYAQIPPENHVLGVLEQLRDMAQGLATRQAPSGEQIERARALGRTRAEEGLAVEAMISAYHIGYRDFWELLLARAQNNPKLSTQLVEVVSLFWTWIRLSSAAADAHAEAIRSLQATQINLTHRFLGALHSGDAGSDEAIRLARALGFDPDHLFQAVCAPGGAWAEDQLDDLQRSLQFARGTIRAATRGPVTVILCQDVTPDVVVSTVHRIRPGLPLGIGLARQGLGGAEAGLLDAEQALRVAELRGGVVRFEEDWLLAVVGTHRQRLSPLLRGDETIGRDHPHLADAVQAFAKNGFSAAAAARALTIHPNTMAYRLDRWHQLTGWDPHTTKGLVSSLLHLALTE